LGRHAARTGFICALAAAWLLFAHPTHAQTIIRDQEIEDTLKIFAAPIFDRAGLTPQNVRFIIVKSGDLNAFVAGGQNIFFYTGLILETETVDELLGVMAHETGHIADGHLLRTRESIDKLSTQAVLANILGAAVAIGTGSGQAAVAAATLGGSLTNRLFFRHSREQENAADNAGIRFLKESGLPVDGFAAFMEKLGSQELLPESQQSAYVRTHPLTADRIIHLRDQASKITAPSRMPEIWHDRHARMKAKLEGYLFPERALSRKDDSRAAQYGRSIAFYRKGKVDEALKLIDALIAEEKDNPYFYEFKGQVLFENGRIKESVDAYRQAVTLHPVSSLMLTSFGHALIEAGGKENMAEAQKRLDKSLRLDAQQPQAHRFLAIIHGKNGQEGLSRLHLAEAALLQGKPDIAKREAGLAKSLLTEKTPARQRADDILHVIDLHEDKDSKG
jgi:predicted Zn-dependent protease